MQGSFHKPQNYGRVSIDRCPVEYRERYRLRCFDFAFLGDGPYGALEQESGQICTFAGSGTPGVIPTTHGYGIDLPGGTGQGTYDLPAAKTHTGDFTFSVVCSFDATPVTVFGGNNSNNGYLLFVDSSTCYSRPTGGALRTASHGGLNTGQTYHFVITRNTSNQFEMFIDGRPLVVTGGALSGNFDIYTVTGYANTDAFQLDGQISHIASWDYRFPDGALQQLFADPYGHYRDAASLHRSIASGAPPASTQPPRSMHQFRMRRAG